MGANTTLLDNFKASSPQNENDVDMWPGTLPDLNPIAENFLGPAKVICLSSVNRRIQH